MKFLAFNNGYCVSDIKYVNKKSYVNKIILAKIISKKENFMPRFIKFVIFISIFLNSNNNLFTLNPSLN